MVRTVYIVGALEACRLGPPYLLASTMLVESGLADNLASPFLLGDVVCQFVALCKTSLLDTIKYRVISSHKEPVTHRTVKIGSQTHLAEKAAFEVGATFLHIMDDAGDILLGLIMLAMMMGLLFPGRTRGGTCAG